MSRTIQAPAALPRRPAPVIAAAALCLALTVSGCASGQISQTAQQVAAVDGGNASVGQISVLNVIFETPAAENYGPGSTVPVSLVISNHGTQNDTLTGVSSPAAASATIASDKIALPAQFNVQVNSTAKTSISLENLNRPLCFGQSVPVTFTFAEAGSVTVRVPIANPVERRGTRDTIDIQPPHETPIWLTGAEGHGDEEGTGSEDHGSSAAEGSMTTMAESSGEGSSEPSMSGAPATAAPASSCNGFDGRFCSRARRSYRVEVRTAAGALLFSPSSPTTARLVRGTRYRGDNELGVFERSADDGTGDGRLERGCHRARGHDTAPTPLPEEAAIGYALAVGFGTGAQLFVPALVSLIGQLIPG